MKLQDKFRGCFLGLAIGDALGAPVEFKMRGMFYITDYESGGTWKLDKGQWTDDTSMALCIAISLIEQRGFNSHDIATRFLKWYKNGYMSSTGFCFDIGNTTREALERFRTTQDPFSGSTHPRKAGNGSIMRLCPISLGYYGKIMSNEYSALSSKITHATFECIHGCIILNKIISNCLDGQSKEEALHLEYSLDSNVDSGLKGILNRSYFNKAMEDIHGSGYVVASLEAALWCFYTTDSFEEAILKAVNLGEDADTTAAVCGQVAGAFYGMKNIPDHLINNLYKKDYLLSIADSLYDFNKI